MTLYVLTLTLSDVRLIIELITDVRWAVSFGLWAEMYVILLIIHNEIQFFFIFVVYIK